MENVWDRLGPWEACRKMEASDVTKYSVLFGQWGTWNVMKIEIYMHRMFPKDTSTSLLPRAAKHVWLEGASVCTGVCV